MGKVPVKKMSSFTDHPECQKNRSIRDVEERDISRAGSRQHRDRACLHPEFKVVWLSDCLSMGK